MLKYLTDKEIGIIEFLGIFFLLIAIYDKVRSIQKTNLEMIKLHEK
jgi:hypothetical protein